MLAAVSTSPGHPAVAILLGLGAAGLAALVVAMAWSVHVRQSGWPSNWPAASSP